MSLQVREMRKAFTLVELAVAVALLAMMISFASLIFDMSIDTYRTAIASAEIMQKLQAITGQLNADFKGLRWAPGGKISFILSGTGVRADRIIFFANGDFQSTSQYNDKTVAGNTAIIFYGLTDANDLIRRQTILTSDTGLTGDFDIDGQTEYYRKSMSELIAESFDVNDMDMMEVWLLNPAEPNDLVTYMAEGVDDFTIQFAKWSGLDNKFEWVPKDESEFEDYPVITTSAFKFTFTLYDSKGILEEGKTFTHIVYLE
jgi:prepilin-type N-terminal cleavage/methylation domain-containing protein